VFCVTQRIRLVSFDADSPLLQKRTDINNVLTDVPAPRVDPIATENVPLGARLPTTWSSHESITESRARPAGRRLRDYPVRLTRL